MNNIQIAKESIRITAERKYEANGQTVLLPEHDYSDVTVITPADGAELLKAPITPGERMCSISVTTESSFGAASRFRNPLVMNYANAHHAGGGFMLGANAQEEALCRCSTLYASIRSDKAAEMYRWNNTHLSSTESDYMLLSQNVAVFRDDHLALLAEPFPAGVITAPAPNRRGAAVFASSQTIKETFLRRIRIILRIAAKYGYRDLILGAWGCGAFGNDPKTVAEAFRTALTEDGTGTLFDNAVFAVYGSETGRNYTAFRAVFSDMLS